MAAPDLRRVSRVLIVDSLDRVLLLRFRLWDGGEVWIPPGGGAEDRETAEETALREVREETGVALPPHLRLVWIRRTHYFGRAVRESYFFARVEGTPEVVIEPVPGGRADLLEYRWWTPAEIAADESGVEFTPLDIAKRLQALLAGEIPREPIELEG